MSAADSHMIRRLDPVAVEKPWGRIDLPPPFAATGGQHAGRRIGEIWFPGPDGLALPLLVKYLFTSEKLSIQVHPSDEQARARGLAAGKEECWYIVDAQPDARLGIGTVRPLAPEELREAAQSGAIEGLMQWHPVAPAMLFHIPPGTIHAIGGGISLIEIQQNSDVTYRLYDYGRPRALHLDDGVAVARPCPYPAAQHQPVDATRSAVLLVTPHFMVAHIVDGDMAPLSGASGPVQVVPIDGKIRAGDMTIAPGECVAADALADIIADGPGRMLVALAHEEGG